MRCRRAIGVSINGTIDQNFALRAKFFIYKLENRDELIIRERNSDKGMLIVKNITSNKAVIGCVITIEMNVGKDDALWSAFGDCGSGCGAFPF